MLSSHVVHHMLHKQLCSCKLCLVTIAKILEALCNDCICQEGFHLMKSVSKY